MYGNEQLVDRKYIRGVSWGGKSYEQPYGLAVDNSGDLYVTGYFRTTVDFDPGPGVDEHKVWEYHIFLSKFDPDLNYIWGKSWGERTDILDHVDFGYDVATDNSSNVYIGGCFYCPWSNLDFDPGPGIDYHTSNGEWDAFLIKVDEDGNW